MFGREDDDGHYYDILHVSRDAPVEIIRGSYRTLMQKLRNHPDLGGDAEVAARINEAYAVLVDEERRATYDAQIDSPANTNTLKSEAPPDSAILPTPAKRIVDLSRECAFCRAPHRFGRTSDTLASCQICRSPLCLADNGRLEATGKRAVARFKKHQEVLFFDRWPQSQAYGGQTQDISISGMKFATRQPVVAGQTIKIVSDVLEAVARIVYYGRERGRWDTQNVVGVSFLTLRFVRATGRFVSEQV